MYCTKCGAKNEDNAAKCVKCGDALTPEVTIPTYLAQAIVCTICCCVPLGIPAIVFAAQVAGRVSMGDIEGARVLSKKAKKWCWIAFISGLIVYILYFCISALMAYLETKK